MITNIPNRSSADQNASADINTVNSSIQTLDGLVGGVFTDDFEINFTSPTDRFLTTPDDEFVSGANFIPSESSAGFLYLIAGGGQWNTGGGDNPGDTNTYSGSLEGPGAGNRNVVFRRYSEGSGDAGETWTSFANNTYDGFKTFNLNTGGGYFEYFYDSVAWTFAFDGTTKDIHIAQSGSVYNDVNMINVNLVVAWDGSIGQAGGGTSLAPSAPKPLIEDAPNNGLQYNRGNKVWSQVHATLS